MQPAPSDVRPVFRISTAILKPVAPLAQDVEGRDAAVLELDRHGRGALEAQLVLLLARNDAAEVLRHHEGRDPAVLVLLGQADVLGEHREELGEPAVGDPVLGAVQHEGVGLLVVDRGRLDRGGIGAGSRLGQREGGDHLAGREPRKPLPLLLLGAEEDQALHADRLVPADQDAQRCVGPADLLGDPAVGRRGESIAAVGLRDRHPERAELGEAPHDLRRNGAFPLDARGVDVVAREGAERVEERGDRLGLGGVDRGIREDRLLRDAAREEGLDDGDEAADLPALRRTDVDVMRCAPGCSGGWRARVEPGAGVGELAQPLGGREARAQPLGQVVQPREHAVGAERVRVAQQAAAEGREARAEDHREVELRRASRRSRPPGSARPR